MASRKANMQLRTPTGRFIGWLFVGLLLAGCSDRQLSWKTHNISGLMPTLDFRLQTPDGRTLSGKDFRGKVVMLYFGYTHCKDVCPATVATSLHALRMLKNKGRDVRFLFVSVDPGRDTPAALKRYIDAYGSSSLVGLTGSQQALRALAKRYRVSYSYGPAGANGNYEVNHSAAIFVFDRKGRVHLLMNYKNGAADMAHDLQQLVDGGLPRNLRTGKTVSGT